MDGVLLVLIVLLIAIPIAELYVIVQVAQSFGVLNTIGMLGVKLEGPVAFNIVNKGEDNAAWLMNAGTLYSVDLKTGKATAAGKIEGLAGKLSDIAWVD